MKEPDIQLNPQPSDCVRLTVDPDKLLALAAQAPRDCRFVAAANYAILAGRALDFINRGVRVA